MRFFIPLLSFCLCTIMSDAASFKSNDHLDNETKQFYESMVAPESQSSVFNTKEAFYIAGKNIMDHHLGTLKRMASRNPSTTSTLDLDVHTSKPLFSQPKNTEKPDDQDQVSLLSHRGLVALMAGKNNDAVYYFEVAHQTGYPLGLDRNTHISILTNLAYAYLINGQYSDAMRTLCLDPLSDDYLSPHEKYIKYRLLGMSYFARQDYQNADRAFNHVLKDSQSDGYDKSTMKLLSAITKAALGYYNLAECELLDSNQASWWNEYNKVYASYIRLLIGVSQEDYEKAENFALKIEDAVGHMKESDILRFYAHFGVVSQKRDIPVNAIYAFAKMLPYSNYMLPQDLAAAFFNAGKELHVLEWNESAESAFKRAAAIPDGLLYNDRCDLVHMLALIYRDQALSHEKLKRKKYKTIAHES